MEHLLFKATAKPPLPGATYLLLIYANASPFSISHVALFPERKELLTFEHPPKVHRVARRCPSNSSTCTALAQQRYFMLLQLHNAQSETGQPHDPVEHSGIMQPSRRSGTFHKPTFTCNVINYNTALQESTTHARRFPRISGNSRPWPGATEKGRTLQTPHLHGGHCWGCHPMTCIPRCMQTPIS